MRVTIKAVNKALADAGIDGEILKGKGYFYFWGKDFERSFTTMVCVCFLSDLSIEQWVNEAKACYNKSED